MENGIAPDCALIFYFIRLPVRDDILLGFWLERHLMSKRQSVSFVFIVWTGSVASS